MMKNMNGKRGRGGIALNDIELIDEIIGHLGAALTQSLPQDDQIIQGNIQAALMYARMLKCRLEEANELQQN